VTDEGILTPRGPAEVARWRKELRKRLIRDRLAMDPETRQRHGERIVHGIPEAVGRIQGLTISAFRPIQGEPDLTPFLEALASRGGRCALPVVVGTGMPLVFRAWAPGDPLEPGVWGIPVPPEDSPVVVPEVVIAPVVGFDRAGYRLGYGGGYFDRTLAALGPGVRFLGVGFFRSALPTIYPQPHDVPMEAVVTEGGIFRPEPDVPPSVGAEGETHLPP
jgi:5-formyltetrahydrofolate cyclo-ligase